MKYAVVQLQGKQYRVSEGDVLTVDHVEVDVNSELTISDVLLVNVDGNTQVGAPTLKDHQVTLKVLEQGKDEKIRVFKYKSKSKYRKTHGHRQHVTNLTVMKIA